MRISGTSRAVGDARQAVRSAFGGLPGAFWWIWLGTLVNRLGSFVLPLFAFYLTGPMHRSAAFAGVVAALYGVGASVSGVVGGVLADRIGRKPTLVASLSANAASIIALGYARSPLWLCLGALTVGLVTNAFRPATSAMIADIVPDAQRVRAYGLNYWAINIGFAVASLSIGLVVEFGYLALFYADAASTLLCVLLIAVFVRDTTPRSAPTPIAHAASPTSNNAATDAPSSDGLATVLRDRVFITFVAVFFLLLLVFQQCNAAQPMAMAHDGLTAAQVGYISAINGVLVVALQLPLVRWLERFPVAPVLAVSGVVLGVGMAVPLLGGSVGIFALSVVIWTIGEIGCTPISSALVARLAPAHLRGRYQGIHQIAWSGSAVLAPLTGGAAFSAFGGTPVWLGCLAIAALAAVAILRLAPALTRRLAQAAAAAAVVLPDQAPEASPLAAALASE
ncbi:MFS transporter [Actinospica sp.]|jgi:MFS family permease|uniref:MDR family MFS transporter n=1 Tax=Actinospica sp. TaxID=1872142 RepID=UPI002CBDCF3F|nr:MFS transporter [Actinospica sp.]HWG22752.1 MFS transporter [Actinospica sp.]